MDSNSIIHLRASYSHLQRKKVYRYLSAFFFSYGTLAVITVCRETGYSISKFNFSTCREQGRELGYICLAYCADYEL